MNVILLTASDFFGATAFVSRQDQLWHIKTVLKATVGDVLKIGMLGGQLGVGQITELTKERVVLDNVCLDRPPPAKLDMTLVLALPRPKVLRRLVIDMTAAGVKTIVLMNSYRTDKAYWQSPLLARLDDFVLEGLQQGVDTVLPTILLEKRFKPFVEDRLSDFPTPIVLAHPYGGIGVSEYKDTPKTLIVGAEGGFIDYEVALMQAQGAKLVSLGERILRTEAAVNVLLGRYL